MVKDPFQAPELVIWFAQFYASRNMNKNILDCMVMTVILSAVGRLNESVLT